MHILRQGIVVRDGEQIRVVNFRKLLPYMEENEKLVDEWRAGITPLCPARRVLQDLELNPSRLLRDSLQSKGVPSTLCGYFASVGGRMAKFLHSIWLVFPALLAAAPAQARFLQTDPVGYRDDPDLYTYVQDDPANQSDPSGMTCQLDGHGAATACQFDAIVGGGPTTQQMNDYNAGETQAVQTLQSGDQNRAVSITVDGKSMPMTAGEAANNIINRYTVADPTDQGPRGGHTDEDHGKIVSTITARGLAGAPGEGTPEAPHNLLGSDQSEKTKLWNREVSAVHELGFHGSSAERGAFGSNEKLKASPTFNKDHQVPYNKGAEQLLGLPVNPGNE